MKFSDKQLGFFRESDMKLKYSIFLVLALTVLPYTMPVLPMYVHFLVPDEWTSGVPVVLAEGQSYPMTASAEDCGWFEVEFNNAMGPLDSIQVVNSEDSEQKFISEIIAPEGYMDWQAEWERTGYFDLYVTEEGFFYQDPELTGICRQNLPVLVRDFHHSTHPNFYLPSDRNNLFYGTMIGNDLSATGLGGLSYNYLTTPFVRSRQYDLNNPCESVTPGIVQPVLGANRKPVYNPASGCFGNPAGAQDGGTWFDLMFNDDPDVNQTVCVEMNVPRAAGGEWRLDTRKQGGYFPVETQTQEPFSIPTPATCIFKVADVYVENFDQLSASEVTVDDLYTFNTEGCALNNYDPEGQEKVALRNNHFCMETHLSFTYKPGQYFALRNSDDAWVYVEGRLVIDHGGIHHMVGSKAVLDTMGLIEGQNYPLDMFVCNRQPTESAFDLETNIYFEQTQAGLFYDQFDQESNVYFIGKTMSGCGLGSGLAVIPGSELNLEYWLEDEEANIVTTQELPTGIFSSGAVYNNGIDVSEPGKVVVSDDYLTNAGLEPGHYRLWVREVENENAKTYISVHVSGYFNSVFNGNQKPFLFKSQGLYNLKGKPVVNRTNLPPGIFFEVTSQGVATKIFQ
jgi:fibro-slime domain-containing protein